MFRKGARASKHSSEAGIAGAVSPGLVSFLFLLWVFAAYAVIALLFDWTGLSHHSNFFVEWLAALVPSIDGYAEVAANRDKAGFELGLAWLFSLSVPVLLVPVMKWHQLYLHSVHIGKPLRRGFQFLGVGLLLLALTLYPSPPSGSRGFGRAVLALLQADSAFVWGFAVILLAGFGWLMSIGGVIQIYKTFQHRGEAE
jgi:hypothetical protein